MKFGLHCCTWHFRSGYSYNTLKPCSHVTTTSPSPSWQRIEMYTVSKFRLKFALNGFDPHSSRHSAGHHIGTMVIFISVVVNYMWSQKTGTNHEIFSIFNMKLWSYSTSNCSRVFWFLYLIKIIYFSDERNSARRGRFVRNCTTCWKGEK